MNRVIHFEIQVDNVERAIKFYQDVFGWTFNRWEENDYWFVVTAPTDSKEPGINGGPFPRHASSPPKECAANAFVCTVQVDNFDEIAEKIEQAGGFLKMPKFAIPGLAWQGYFLDAEGNTFGVHQPDESAS